MAVKENKKETKEFSAEVGKILHLMIHALYENKDIFLRELISNASDACDRLRYKALTDSALLEQDSELKITIAFDAKNRSLSIADNGIGMSKAEMISNLGTIARSGTQAFLEKLSGDQKKDAALIGQFGVGFYSSFMVAERVEVTSTAAGGKKTHRWASMGNGAYTIEEAEEKRERGTTVTLFLKEGEEEYADPFRIRHIVETYSNHVAFPIELVEENNQVSKLNKGTALWQKDKSAISEDEYKEFYKSLSYMGPDEPWLTLHNKVEGAVNYTNLLFIPSKRPFDLFHPDRSHRVKLFIKRVFIADEGIQIIPSHLRFLRGVVDSDDLPLNISRETVQNNAIVQKISRAIAKKVLSELKKKSEQDKDAFAAFWQNFGAVLKEGLCDAFEARDELLEVCRFHSVSSGEGLISLAEYKANMKPEQKEIYYLLADDIKTALSHPQLEGFKTRGIDVLLLTDSVDDFWVTSLHQYQGIDLQSITRGDIDLDSIEKVKSPSQDAEAETSNEENKNLDAANLKPLIDCIKKTLGSEVFDVRVTSKLSSSPVCLSAREGAMDLRMERFMVANHQLPSKQSKILEINPKHPIITSLLVDVTKNASDTKIADTIHLLFAQANIIEGESFNDVKGFVERLNRLISGSLAA